jgi:hypothetical protein
VRCGVTGWDSQEKVEPMMGGKQQRSALETNPVSDRVSTLRAHIRAIVGRLVVGSKLEA